VHTLVADGSSQSPCILAKNMIRLTRLNNQGFTVNSDLIKFVEQSPDTLITLVTGEKIVVRESVAEVLALVIEFRRSVLQSLSSLWDSSSFHTLLPDPRKREPGK
jgi:flagellar protein FlbD